LPDVIDHTGNKLHPQKSIHILKPLIESFTQPGDLVLRRNARGGSIWASSLTPRTTKPRLPALPPNNAKPHSPPYFPGCNSATIAAMENTY
jgi:hypothetical protein